jgi:proton glutamate symport protein
VTLAARLPSLTTQVFISLVAGIVVGYFWPAAGLAVAPLSTVFLRLIKMLIAPLLFSTLVVGIGGNGDLQSAGRIGLKAMLYFQATTVVAFAVSLALVNLLKPGVGVVVALGSAAETAQIAKQPGAWEVVLNIFPTSVVDAMARGDVLQLVVFATFFGAGVAAIGHRGKPILDVLESAMQAMFVVTRYVVALAPIGVFGAIASTVAEQGFGIVVSLSKLILVVYLGLALYLLIVVGATAYMIRVPALAFLRAMRQPFLLAFTTASSEAALPRALEILPRFGVPKHVASFVLPAGYSFNQDGSTLYLATATLFIAQLAGTPLSWGQQGVMMLTLLLASNGIAGVPRAAVVVLSGTLATFGLPVEAIAIVLGVDHILDMGRTATNFTGNSLATVAVARWEGVFDDEQMRAFERAPA